MTVYREGEKKQQQQQLCLCTVLLACTMDDAQQHTTAHANELQYEKKEFTQRVTTHRGR